MSCINSKLTSSTDRIQVESVCKSGNNTGSREVEVRRPAISAAAANHQREELPQPSRAVGVRALVPKPPGLPIMSRKEVSSQQPHSRETKYVIATLNTPVRAGNRSGTGQSLESDARLPLWASGGWDRYSKGSEVSPVTPPDSVDRSGLLLRRSDRFDSGCSVASLRFAPDVFVQAWHLNLSDTYEIVRVVGEGRSGAVFIVRHKHFGRYCACKFLHKIEHDPDALQNEVQTLRRLDHPNIVRLYEVYEDQDTVFLIMELCGGGELYNRIDAEGCIDETTARIFAQQMLNALAYCHSNGVVHRDVKPENFLLETNDSACTRLKLADFGVATSIRPAHLFSAVPLGKQGSSLGWPSFCDDAQDGECGSLPYMAPERLRYDWRSLVVDAERRAIESARDVLDPGTPTVSGTMAVLGASDLWSCGVVIFVMLSGEFPFGDDPARILDNAPPDFSGSAWNEISLEAVDLIKKLFNHDPQRRLTASQALQHPWFKQHSPCPEALLARQHSSFDAEVLQMEPRRGCAVALLRSLRQWRRMPQLRRIALTAIAKRLEPGHEMHGVAHDMYKLFGGSSSTLRCETLVRALNEALGDSICHTLSDHPYIGATTPINLAGLIPPAICESPPSAYSPRALSKQPLPCATSAQRSPHGPQPMSLDSPVVKSAPVVTSSGTCCTPSPTQRALRLLHSLRPSGASMRSNMRERIRSLAHRSLRVYEFTTKPKTTDYDATATGSSSSSGHETEDRSVADVTELENLVSSLDGTKDGRVDFSLLMAALLPVGVYSDEQRIKEAFDLFDVQRRGRLSARDLAMALRSPNVDMERCAELVKPFDRSGFGTLCFSDFKDMIRGLPCLSS